MHLSNIKLWNFRKFGTDETLHLDKPDLNLNFTNGLNVIVGENDSGKTAIIDAIKLVLKTHSYDYIKVEDKDFYQSSNRLRIQLTFTGLQPHEAKNFTEWLGWYGDGADAKPFLQVSYDVQRQGKRIFPADVKAGVDDIGYLLTAEAREYLKATYLRPLRDAESELVAKRNSRLSQILLGDSAFKGKEKDHELVFIFDNLREELNKYFKGEFKVAVLGEDGVHQNDEQGQPLYYQPDGGKQIKTKIDSYIQGFYGNKYETLFNASSNDIKSILEKLTLFLKDENNPGLGTLNRLFMAAELLHLNKDNWSGVRLGLIEELEAHLHPQAQMQVIEALQKQNSIQLILTTHSPNLASKLKLENLIVCNNGRAFPMGKQYTMLADADYRFLEKFLDVTKANLFFAKGVILVEGWAEEILIPSIAKKIGINLTENGISIVNVGSLAFNRYANIFLRKQGPPMAIPVAIITDSDVPEYEKNGDIYQKRSDELVAKEAKVKLLEIESNSVSNVKYFPAPFWTLEYSLFKSTCLNSVLQEAIKAVHVKTNWDNFESELGAKLINKGLKKTEIAYLLADNLDSDFNKPVADRKIPSISENDSIMYLVNAIKYVSGN